VSTKFWEILLFQHASCCIFGQMDRLTKYAKWSFCSIQLKQCSK
jgi:hypothetical protein